MVEDLEATLSGLGIDACDLLGHSMGGMVAVRFALARPERVSSLILMDTSARSVEAVPKQLMDLAVSPDCERLYLVDSKGNRVLVTTVDGEVLLEISSW